MPSIPRAWPRSNTTSTRESALQTDRKYLEMGLDTLRALADNTDGRAIINRNDIGKGMQQIIRDASAYYLLVTTPPRRRPTGGSTRSTST